MLFQLLLVLVIILNTFLVETSCKKESNEEFFHQRPDQHKSLPGWQEPGLWRPKWVMDRKFQDKKSDRIYFKMKSDRTIHVYRNRDRPLFEWMKKTSKDVEKKKLFETGSEQQLDTIVQAKALQAEQQALYNADGTWWWADESPLPTGKVKIELKEPDNGERIRHETRCDWGKVDGYAARFRTGRIYRFKGVKSAEDIPLTTYLAGSFTIRANVHRPLVSKDFLAFQ